jgi:putative glutamine amidotransferase
MSSHRPTLLISNALPERPGEALYNAHVDRMWASLTAAAAPGWDVVREFAQLDGDRAAVSAARLADAVILMGGEDVDPRYYGGAADYPGASRHWARADVAQIAIVRAAVRHRIPLLGICRGLQVIGVALGATLVQDIPGTRHHNPHLLRDHHFARHEVAIRAGSRLAGALGEGPVEVHSAHHQSLDRVPGSLEVTARSADGVVEAVEHRRAPVMGVQWHPEDPEADPEALAALLGLLAARAQRRPAGSGTGSRRAA